MVIVFSACKEKKIAVAPIKPVVDTTVRLKTLFGITSAVREKINNTKNSRTPFQQKISSEILELIEQYKESKNKTVLSDEVITNEGKTITVSPAILNEKNSVLVYLYLSGLSSKVAPLIDDIAHFGVSVASKNDSIPIYQAWVPIDKFDTLSTFKGITAIRLVTRAHSNVGNELTEGDHTMHCDAAREVWPNQADGNGIKVGVISGDCGSTSSDIVSGNITYLDRSIASGDLTTRPFLIIDSANNPPGITSRIHEGLEMMEIVQDLAPKAQLAFATGVWGMVDFANKIDALAQAGCNIITDDLLYDEEPMFEDGEVAKTIERASNIHQIVYTAAAGNLAKNVFSFDFSPITTSIGGTNRLVHNNVNGTSYSYPTTITIQPSQSADIVLQWDDPFENSNNDFDFYLVDVNNPNSIIYANDLQNGSHTVVVGGTSHVVRSSPLETKIITVVGAVAKTYALYVVRNTVTDNPTPRMKLMIYQGALSLWASQPSSIIGHSTSKSVLACGAMVDGDQAQLIEDFSSLGPATIVQTGAPIAGTQRPLAQARVKPDVMAVDGIMTSVNDQPFKGTSAAAPHVAGIAALLLSAVPSLKTNANAARDIIRNGCLAFGVKTPNPMYGYGKADAFRTVAQAITQLNSQLNAAGFQAPQSRVLIGSRQSVSKVIDLRSTTTLPKINEMYVSVTLSMFGQRNSLLIELLSQNPTPVKFVLVNRPTRNWSRGPNEVYDLQARITPDNIASRLADHHFIIPINSMNLGFGPLTANREWVLRVTADDATGDSFFAPSFTIRGWGIYCR